MKSAIFHNDTIISLLVTSMCFRWGNSTSPDFLVGNGINQGRIISSIFFNIYMDD